MDRVVARRGTRSRLHFRLPLDPARLLRARQRIRDYLHEHGVAGDVIDAVVLSVEEAMTNAVRHSGAAADLEVHMGFEGGDLHATVEDKGAGFDVARFDRTRLPDPLAPGGRGLYLIAQLSDDMRLRRDGGVEVSMLWRGATSETVSSPGPETGVIDGRLLSDAGYEGERRRFLTEELGEGFAALDWEYRFTFANQTALQLYTLAREEVVGKLIWDLFPQLADTALGRGVREAMELGNATIVEFHSTVVGRWLECRVYPTASGASLFLRDIEDRKRKEDEHDELFEALSESEGRFRSLFESMTEGVALHEVLEQDGRATDYRILDVNPAFERQSSLPAGRVRGRLASEAYGTGAAPYLEEYARVVATGESVSFETYFPPVARHFRITAFAFAPHRFATVFEDVTERTRADEERERLLDEARRRSEELQRQQAALYAEREQLRTVIEQTDASICLLDPDFDFVIVNSTYAEACGRSPDELIGSNHFDLFPHEENEAIFRRVRDTGEPEQYLAKPFEFADQPERGVTFWDWRLAPVKNGRGVVTGLVLSLVEVTERVRANLLADALSAINRTVVSLDSDHILTSALRLAAEALGSDAGSVARRGDGVWTRTHVWNMPLELVGEAHPAEDVRYAELAAVELRPVLLEDYASDRLGNPELAERLGIASAMAIPLAAGGRATGCLLFTWYGTPHRFTGLEVDFAQKVGALLSQALENAELVRGLETVARTLQENFVHPLPRIAGLELGALSLPARQPELVGGDFHDVVALQGGLVVALIGDVMGKGIKAAGLTETVRSAVRALSLSSASPDVVLRQANRLLLSEDHAVLVTALAVLLDSQNGRGFLASAGHPPPVHVSAGAARLIEPLYGPPLGSFDAKFSATQFALAPGESLVLYTDGLTEARRDGALFGEERLLEVLASAPDVSPQKLVETLRAALLDFSGELRDDVQILVVRRAAQVSHL